MEYTQDQRTVIYFDIFKNLSIIAPPGSGKTECIAAKAAHIIETQPDLPEGSVWVTTFTNKAADEIKSRIALKTGNSKAVYASNIHKAAMMLLRDFQANFSYLSGVPSKRFSVIDAGDQRTLIDSFAKAAMSESNEVDDDKYRGAKDLIQQISLMKSNLDDRYHLFLSEFELRAFQQYEEYCRVNALLDFEDIINVTANLIETHLVLREYLATKVRFMLVDEYQDISSNQERLITRIRGEAPITNVGDDLQSIYQFRGASREHFRKFPERHNAHVVHLHTNFRSNSWIVDASRAIVTDSDNRFTCAPSAELNSSKFDSIRHIECDNDAEESSKVINEIKALIEVGTPLNEIAVLYRNHYLAENLIKELNECGIPFYTHGRFNYWERKEIRCAMAYLSFAFNDSNKAALKTILENFKGVGKATIARILKGNSNHLDNLKVVNPSVFNIVETVLLSIKSATYTYQIQEFINSFPEAFGTLLDDDDDCKRKENLSSLASLIASSKVESLEQLLEEIYLNRDNSSESGNAIQLMTMHASKGKQFEAVFIIGFYKGVFPGVNANRDDEERLFFVAFTRAKDMIYLMGRRKRNSPFLKNVPSRFITKIEGDEDLPQDKKQKALLITKLSSVFQRNYLKFKDDIASFSAKWLQCSKDGTALDFATLDERQLSIAALINISGLEIGKTKNTKVCVSNTRLLRAAGRDVNRLQSLIG